LIKTSICPVSASIRATAGSIASKSGYIEKHGFGPLRCDRFEICFAIGIAHRADDAMASGERRFGEGSTEAGADAGDQE